MTTSTGGSDATDQEPVDPPGRGVAVSVVGLAALLAAAVVVWGAVAGLGVLLTEVVAARQVDLAVLRAVLEVRSPGLTTVVGLVDRLGDTPVDAMGREQARGRA